MFLLVLLMDDDVVHQAQNTRQVVKDLVHPSLEVLRGARDTKEHLVETKVAKWGRDFSSMGICQKATVGIQSQWY